MEGERKALSEGGRGAFIGVVGDITPAAAAAVAVVGEGRGPVGGWGVRPSVGLEVFAVIGGKAGIDARVARVAAGPAVGGGAGLYCGSSGLELCMAGACVAASGEVPMGGRMGWRASASVGVRPPSPCPLTWKM